MGVRYKNYLNEAKITYFELNPTVLGLDDKIVCHNVDQPNMNVANNKDHIIQ